MGLFDRFKKKEEPEVKAQSSVFRREPLTLTHSDGREENIYFNGLIEVDGKTLMTVGIEQEISSDGTSVVHTYLIEPKFSKDEHGNNIDITEQYYKELGIHPRDGGDARKYNAIKGFFQHSQIGKDKMGSNYIGSLEYNDQKGQYYRGYDNNFRQKYIERTKISDFEKEQTKLEKEYNKQQEIQAIMDKGKRNEDIYSRMQQGRATDDEIAEYYANVSVKHKEDRQFERDGSNRYTGMI